MKIYLTTDEHCDIPGFACRVRRDPMLEQIEGLEAEKIQLKDIFAEAQEQLFQLEAENRTIREHWSAGSRRHDKLHAQIRKQHSNAVRARDAAIELLTHLQAERDATVIGGIAGFTDDQRDLITEVIALLDGSAEGESNES